MVKKYFHNLVLVFFCVAASGLTVAQSYNTKAHIELSLRMIGHKILLNSKDSTSLVLPVEQDANQYKIQFGSNFQFEPEQLVATIDNVVNETEIAERYLVEVKDCYTGQVVYSYEKGNSVHKSIVPCTGRIQPKACYTILFTILEPMSLVIASNYNSVNSVQVIVPTPNQPNYLMIALLIFSVVLLTGIFAFFRIRKPGMEIHSNIISLGEYQFDKRNMELLHQNDKTELTGKEAELLYLLYNKVNSTIDRTIILKEVWGDDGDYVGRTLDVYISKLRKKLEADANLRIVNIRGIGYKLVMNT
jgi:DNA-binding winged helix-turn-helix (wHTH) protein